MRYVKIDPHVPDLKRHSDGAAGLDLYAVPDERDTQVYRIVPGETLRIPCGVAGEIPRGSFGLLTLRSGQGIRDGLLIHVGIIDEDYRGQIFARVHNPLTIDCFLVATDGTLSFDPAALRERTREIRVYERFAQLTIVPYNLVHPELVPEISRTARGDRWANSTGRR